MAHKTARQKKVEAEKAALRQRLEDIARGAHGHHSDPAFFVDECYTLGSELGLEGFARFIQGVQSAWSSEKAYDVTDVVTRVFNYEHWDQPWPKVIDWAYERGLRA